MKIALFNLGFRPFFLGAGLCAVASMSLWALIYSARLEIPLNGLTASQWHAHEMIYGYALAVIAGFLLTAIRNWTAIPTPTGLPLAILFATWLGARLLLLFGTRYIELAAAADMLFILLLMPACLMPIVRTRQWRQTAVLSKLILLGTGNLLFYAGALGMLEHGVQWSLYGGFYLIIALILTMGRRLIPLFTERGVDPPVALRNSRLLDLSSLVLLLVFWIAEVFLLRRDVAAVCSSGLFLVNTVRLAFWYTNGIWRRPLLWSLYVAFALIDLGFLLHALSVVGLLAPSLALHCLAIGGVGLITLSMMARVALGHTGRSVHQAPRILLVPLALLLVAFLLRVALPSVMPAYYASAVIGAQFAWIAAFTVFCAVYFPILTRARADGAPG